MARESEEVREEIATNLYIYIHKSLVNILRDRATVAFYEYARKATKHLLAARESNRFLYAGFSDVRLYPRTADAVLKIIIRARFHTGQKLRTVVRFRNIAKYSGRRLITPRQGARARTSEYILSLSNRRKSLTATFYLVMQIAA